MATKAEKLKELPQRKAVKSQSQQRDEVVADMVRDFTKLDIKHKNTFFEQIGIGNKYFICNSCGRILTREAFYVNTAPGCKTGVTSICKNCADLIASPEDVNGNRLSPTKESVDDALYALDKPFLESVWDSSLLEAADSTSGMKRSNVWKAYIKNIQMRNYNGMQYRESDSYNGIINMMTYSELPKDKEILEQFEKNKNDVRRLLGYLPFEKESDGDQPFLYSQLIGFLDSDEEGNDDMMRVSSIISICRSFLQKQKLDDMIAVLSSDTRNVEKNISTVRALSQMQNQITQSITKLAEQSCISLKNSKTSTRGENTWTGKLKKIRELNLRNYEINGYDINTCKGMQQVADISIAAILKNLHFDESDWSDMVARQTKEMTELRSKRDAYEEAFRIVLRENINLRDKLSAHRLLDKEDLVDLGEIVNDYVMTTPSGGDSNENAGG